MNKLELRATFLDGRYRLDRLVVAHDDVIIWDATDLAHGRSVQLSVFECGSTVLDQGKIAGGMFVAVDRAERAPQLETPREDDFEREPIRRRRAWPWAVAGLTCALALAGWYVVASSRGAHPVSETTTITAARLPAPEIPTTPAPVVVVVPPPDLPRAVEAPVIAQPPQHHAKPAPLPVLQKPKPAKPHAPPTTNFDPLTI